MIMEMRWLEWQEEEVIMPPPELIQYGKKIEPTLVTKRKLQYRRFVNSTVYAGIPSTEFTMQTAKMEWTDWVDVPTVTEKKE
jgi:hypothetical protein